MNAVPADPRLVRTWIEVSAAALAGNFRFVRGLLSPDVRLMAVAKSNAYGHGLYDFVPLADRLGADWFGVDSIVEAVTLREIGVQKPILVLGYTLPARFEEAAAHRISLTVSSFESLAALGGASLPNRIKVHVKIDTGLHRQGFLPEEVPALIDALRSASPRIEVEGLFTHFAQAKDPGSPDYTRGQIRLFEQASRALSQAGIRPLRHACATAGALLYPEARFDMARIGIGLYGLWPSPKMARERGPAGGLSPCLAWRAILSEIKRLPKGAGVGYDLTAVLERDSTVGVCPVGYWHGYPRSLSNAGEVLVRGRRAKVLGTVTMDMIVVDLTDVPGPAVGDVVTLVGRDGGDEITAYEAAARAGQSYYELLTRLNPLIQKYYLDGFGTA